MAPEKARFPTPIRARESTKELCYKIKGQTAIVTGASSGLGISFAEALAEEGVNVVIAARRFEKLAKVAEELTREHDVKVIPTRADVSNEDDVKSMIRTAVERFGSLEIIVNNAGIASRARALLT